MPKRTSAVRSVLERLGLSDRTNRKGLLPAKRRALSLEPLELRQLLSVTLTHPPVVPVQHHPAPVSSVHLSASIVKMALSISPQLVSTISTAVGGLLFPSGVATDSAGDVFIADTYHNRILEFSTAGVLSTVAVGANLLYPSAVAVDSSGDIFIADTWHNRVLEVSASGVTTTVASGLLLPGGLAVDNSGDLFIADTWHERVLEVTLATGATTTVASGLLLPTGLAADSSGDLFIADTYHNRVIEATLATGATTTVFSGNYPTGLAVDSSGDLFIAETILAIASSSGAPRAWSRRWRAAGAMATAATAARQPTPACSSRGSPRFPRAWRWTPRETSFSPTP